MLVTVRQIGRTLGVTAPGGLPPQLERYLDDRLTYYFRVRDGFGGFVYTTQSMYTRVSNGIGCSAGFRAGICKLLSDKKVPYEFVPDPYYSSAVFTPDWDGLVRRFKFRDRQDQALLALAAADSGIVSAATGWGKGYLLSALASLWPKAVVHIITRTTDVHGQLYDVLRSHLGPGIGIVGNGKYTPARITVCTADSAHRLNPDADVVIGDEIHELAAPTYVGQMTRFSRARFYGFTASLERDDGKHAELEGLFGQVVFTMTTQEATASKSIVPVTIEWLNPSMTEDPIAGVTSETDCERLGVWRNDVRNQMFVDRALKIPRDESVVLMVNRVEHACVLKAMLPDWDMVYGHSDGSQQTVDNMVAAGILKTAPPRMTAKRRKTMMDGFRDQKIRKVIATYVWSTGVDFRHLRWLIRADAGGGSTKSKQIPGRVCRQWEDGDGVKTGGTVIDSWDHFNPGLLRRSQARRTVYNQRGYVQLPIEGRTQRGKKYA